MNATIITIAVMNCDPFAREGMVSILNRNRNFKVITEACSGNDLITQLQRQNTLPQVVIFYTDNRLIEAYSTIAYIRTKFPMMKVIVLSPYLNHYYTFKMIYIGIAAYLIINTNTASEIVKAVQTVVNDKYYYGQIGQIQFDAARHTVTSDLTEKEIQFLKFFCEGLPVKEIAKRMFVSARTIENYTIELCAKVGVANKFKLVRFAINAGIIAAG